MNELLLDMVASADGRERRVRVILGPPINDLRDAGEVVFLRPDVMRPVVDAIDLDTNEHVHLDASAHRVIALALYSAGMAE